MTFTPDIPGRGSWTTKGGMLPPPSKPTSKSGYFRAAKAGETAIGSAVFQGKETSDSYVCVWTGVKVLQRQLNMQLRTNLVVDGWLGPLSDKAIRAYQEMHDLSVDGMVGPATMKQMLTSMVVASALVQNVPTELLGGLAVHESEMCPCAVGDNGWDHGLLAINLDAHRDSITWPQAMDPTWSLSWAARELRETYDQWFGKTRANPWDIAIANHNSPRAAVAWAKAGHPVDDPNRLFPIQEYVDKVKEAW